MPGRVPLPPLLALSLSTPSPHENTEEKRNGENSSEQEEGKKQVLDKKERQEKR